MYFEKNNNMLKSGRLYFEKITDFVKRVEKFLTADKGNLSNHPDFG